MNNKILIWARAVPFSVSFSPDFVGTTFVVYHFDQDIFQSARRQSKNTKYSCRPDIFLFSFTQTGFSQDNKIVATHKRKTKVHFKSFLKTHHKMSTVRVLFRRM